MGQKLTRIGLFIPPTPGYFTDVVMGVQEYARLVGGWAVEVCQTLQIADATTSDWTPDGVLVNCSDGDWQPLLNRLGVPAVQVGGDALPGLPHVLTDNLSIGRTAASHFMERGFTHFAYCGYAGLAWSVAREVAYRETLVAAGHACETWLDGGYHIHTAHITDLIAAWIKKLPKPVAIFACHDRAAMLLGHACAYLGVEVPDQVAILGVDNNPLECGFTSPPISSVMGSARRIGYHGAQLLDRLLKGEKVPATATVVAPAGIAERASTDVFAADDADLVAALRFIKEHADEMIEVADVARATIVTRRMLERKFRFFLGRSPREHILKVHVEQAKKLLIETNMPMLEVALRSGFPSGSKFSAVFKRETSHSPVAFRRMYGLTTTAGPVHRYNT